MKQLTYIADILKDKQFKVFLDDAICEELHRRNTSLVMVQTYNLELRRNRLFQLESKGLFTVEGLTREFELIGAKQSKLSAHERQFIHGIVDECIMKTIEYYKAKERESLINKVKRKLKLV